MGKRFVLSGYFGFKNFGDEAILSVLVNKLQQAKHHLTIISSDPQYTKSKFRHIRSVYTFDIKNIAGFIYKSDCLISGGGSLLQDVTSTKSLLYYLFIIFIALILRKKVIIFAQGIGPIKSSFGQLLTKLLLKHCSYISVRDKKSRELLADWGIKSDLVYDPIFSTKVEPVEKITRVAVQLRSFKTLTEDFIDRLALKIYTEFKNIPVIVLPLQQSMDTETCTRFKKALQLLEPDTKIELLENLTDEEIISNIAGSEYLIAMRFHAIIAGLISEVKTLGINYDIKVKKLCNEFNLPCIELDKNFKDEFTKLKKLNLDNISSKIKQVNFDWSGFDAAVKSLKE